MRNSIFSSDSSSDILRLHKMHAQLEPRIRERAESNFSIGTKRCPLGGRLQREKSAQLITPTQVVENFSIKIAIVRKLAQKKSNGSSCSTGGKLNAAERWRRARDQSFWHESAAQMEK